MKTDALVMLDLDGTLIDSSPLYFIGVPLIVERHLGFTPSRQDILAMWGKMARILFDHFAREAGRQDEGLVDVMYAEFQEFYNGKHNELTRPYDGVCALLPRLREAVHNLVVVTTRPTSRSAPVLEMSWAGDVDGFVWGDQVERNKPSPDGIEKAIADYGGKGRTCVYLGDNPHDMMAAKAARPETLAVAALWDAMDRKALLDAEPDRSFETFAGFADWILQGCPGQESRS